MNCVICDDDKFTVEEFKIILEKSLRDNECVGNISTYTDSRTLYYDIREYKPIDLAVIDIEMPYFNGMQIATELKKRFPECCIIFLTSYIKYAVESYELDIFRYAQKSEIGIKLPKYLDEALNLLKLQDGYVYTVLKSENLERLPYNQMVCIVKDGKYSVIKCVDGREIRVRKTLQEVADELDENEFIAVDRGALVNVAMITRVAEHEVQCKNGITVPISRAKLKQTKSKVALYWGEKM